MFRWTLRNILDSGEFWFWALLSAGEKGDGHPRLTNGPQNRFKGKGGSGRVALPGHPPGYGALSQTDLHLWPGVGKTQNRLCCRPFFSRFFLNTTRASLVHIQKYF
jgi:hypothetical protein